MLFNVAQLLKQPVGSQRVYTVTIDPSDLSGELPIVAAVHGQAKFVRIRRSIIVTADLATRVRLECSRCLDDAVIPLLLQFSEEYFSKVDVVTGVPLEVPLDGFTISDLHILDLSEAIRQYTILNIPMKPLCGSACRGLCSQCGNNLNLTDCRCQRRESPAPSFTWGSLQVWLDRYAS